MTTASRVSGIPSANLLASKSVIITGAGTGIGRAIARVFHREGARILAADFSGAQNTLPEELGEGVIPFHADVTVERDVEAMFEMALEAFGRVDALVNNAGTVFSRQPELSTEYFADFTQTNLLGVMLCCKYGVRAMSANGGGSIVNVSSVSSLNTEGRTALAYAAAKAGVNSLTKTLAVRHGAQGIRVNAIGPGFTHSDTNLRMPPEMLAEMDGKSALCRGSDPEEQAQVAAFLASDRASFISGAIIPVDGGWSARMV
jgi:NAD(P)-dependent dehydrogenase (short-subunit alcohol dehydrogenase family)